MATYNELAEIRQDAQFAGFLDKVRVAVVIRAVAYLNEVSPTAQEVDWAKQAIGSPGSSANGVVWYVIGENASRTMTQIFNATDVQVQAAVDAAVPKLLLGTAPVV